MKHNCPKTKLKNIHENTKISSTQHGRIHNAWHSIKNIRYAKKLIDTTQNEEKSQSVKPTQNKHRWENLQKRMLKQ